MRLEHLARFKFVLADIFGVHGQERDAADFMFLAENMILKSQLAPMPVVDLGV